MTAGAMLTHLTKPLTRRANQRHDAIIAARVTGGALPNPSKPAQSNLTRKRKLLEKRRKARRRCGGSARSTSRRKRLSRRWRWIA